MKQKNVYLQYYLLKQCLFNRLIDKLKKWAFDINYSSYIMSYKLDSCVDPRNFAKYAPNGTGLIKFIF